MTTYLLVDFGSTYTKLTAVDQTKREIIGTSKAYTTVETNVLNGYKTAYNQLTSKHQISHIDQTLACSSAKGGFKMVAIGLSPTLTAEAAKRAALGAGTRILNVYSYGLKSSDIKEIESLQPDVILLSGGTNGGNEKNILNDAKLLTELSINIPIVIAGNEEIYPEIKALFKQHCINFYLTENVMPQINHLNALPTRNILRQIFIENIIKAKGMGDIQANLTAHIIPTPTAVLNAAELLAQGTATHKGYGNTLIVDVGGATTDIHSIGNGKSSKKNVQLSGLEEPFCKRTVEGDLGMRYSALSLLESVTPDAFNSYTKIDTQRISQMCHYRSQHPEYIADTKEDKELDNTIAKLAIKHAVKRHAGYYVKEQTPSRTIYHQYGKDLTTFNTIIGTGGIIVHNQHPEKILTAALSKTEETILTPENSELYVDKDYILSAIGLLSTVDKELAFDIAIKHLKRVK